MAVATDLHRSCNNLRQEGSLEVVIDWLKKRSTSWDPTKNVPTKQITCPDGSTATDLHVATYYRTGKRILDKIS